MHWTLFFCMFASESHANIHLRIGTCQKISYILIYSKRGSKIIYSPFFLRKVNNSILQRAGINYFYFTQYRSYSSYIISTKPRRYSYGYLLCIWNSHMFYLFFMAPKMAFMTINYDTCSHLLVIYFIDFKKRGRFLQSFCTYFFKFRNSWYFIDFYTVMWFK